MSEEIYEGTPLEGYLNETQTAEDWGIESNGDIDTDLEDFVTQGHNLTSHESSGHEQHNNEQRYNESQSDEQHNNDERTYTHGRFFGPNKQQIPLILGNGRVYTEEARFRQSLRSLLSQKVSFEETNRFLDQFHYTIISSSLLESHPLFNTWSIPSDARRKKLLYNQRMPWTHLYVEPVFRVTGGSGIVTLCLFLHYKYRLSSTDAERTAVGVIISIALVVYFFATSRRRLLRSLRKRALVYMEMFTQSAKYFDGDCVRALRNLQDMDIVANGFAPLSKPSFLSTSANNRIAGKKLRSILASALHLVKEAYLDAFKDCVCMGQKESLEQFLHIYDVKSQMIELNFEMSDKFVGFVEPQSLPFEGADACYVSVTDLKREVRKIHMLRRSILCCLLSAQSSGKSDTTELEIWTTICDHLLNASNLTEQLSNLITNERLSPIEESKEAVPNNASKKHQTASFVDAFARIKHLSARLDIVHDSQLSPEEIQQHIEAVDGEIADLSQRWKVFLETCSREAETDDSDPYNKQRHQRQKDHQHSEAMNSTQMGAVSSPTLIMTPEASEISAFGAYSVPELVDTSDDATIDSFQQNSSVLEGEAPVFVLPKSNLSREDRIQIAKRGREVGGRETSASSSRKGSLVLELNSVLSRRH